MYTLRRAACLDDDQWGAIQDSTARLDRAIEHDDWRLAVGTAKELCETTAKLVHIVTGKQFGSATSMQELVTTAQKLVGRLPGPSHPKLVKEIAQSARGLVTRIGELRNEVGTGHGRTTVPALDDADALFAVEASLAWCRWVLSRLDMVASGSPTQLIADLRSEIFRRGLLAQRLTEANLPGLDDTDQRAIGLAVGQRAARGTGVVWENGVRDPAESPDLTAWPKAYREGVAEGLLIDEDGRITLTPGHLKNMVDIVSPLRGRGAGVLRRIAEVVGKSTLSRMTKRVDRETSLAKLDEMMVTGLSKDVADALILLKQRIEAATG